MPFTRLQDFDTKPPLLWPAQSRARTDISSEPSTGMPQHRASASTSALVFAHPFGFPLCSPTHVIDRSSEAGECALLAGRIRNNTNQ
jgi:hypothetical protein